jgi:hypothetical protein
MSVPWTRRGLMNGMAREGAVPSEVMLGYGQGDEAAYRAAVRWLQAMGVVPDEVLRVGSGRRAFECFEIELQDGKVEVTSPRGVTLLTKNEQPIEALASRKVPAPVVSEEWEASRRSLSKLAKLLDDGSPQIASEIRRLIGEDVPAPATGPLTDEADLDDSNVVRFPIERVRGATERPLKEGA